MRLFGFPVPARQDNETIASTAERGVQEVRGGFVSKGSNFKRSLSECGWFI
jgi:hypothetical protein